MELKKFLLLFFLFWNEQLLFADNLYVDAFYHFIELVLSNRYDKGDTICIKEVFGITDAFPSEINGYSIMKVNEQNVDDIPVVKGMGDCKRMVYYIYPLRFVLKNSDIKVYVGIQDELCLQEHGNKLNRAIEEMRAKWFFFYKYDKETERFDYVSYDGALSSPAPWRDSR